MRNEIRVAKKLFEHVKTPYQDGYYVKMLPTSKYAGYQFLVSSYYFYVCATYGEILKSKNEGYRFTLEKIDREPGKRYSRPKLSFEELQAEFAKHSAQFYSDALPQALAYTKSYADDGTRNAGRVMATTFCIGGYDKTWFYESDSERRRLNSNGVRILKYLTPEEVKPMKEKLARFYKLKNSSQAHSDVLIKGDEFFIYKAENALSPETLKKVWEKVHEINQLVNEEREAMRAELAELERYFNTFLKGSEGANTDE